jgi:hypothetical protein
MASFEVVFDDEVRVPETGETVEIDGALWDVARVEEAGGTRRVHLVTRSHIGPTACQQLAPVSRPVTLAPPTSFESELVYTLNDLSSRLSTLAGALDAYWGTGARGAA